MTALALDKDILPLSEFRSHAKNLIDKIRRTHRPLVITQHGKGAAVLISVAEYQLLLDKIELLEDIRKAEGQITAGLTFDHATARKRVLQSIP